MSLALVWISQVNLEMEDEDSETTSAIQPLAFNDRWHGARTSLNLSGC